MESNHKASQEIGASAPKEEAKIEGSASRQNRFATLKEKREESK